MRSVKTYLGRGSLCPTVPHNGEVRRYHVLGSHHIIKMQCTSGMADASSEGENILGIRKARLRDVAILRRDLELLF